MTQSSGQGKASQSPNYRPAAPASPAPPRRSGYRVSESEAFFDAVHPWSEHKHVVLEKYMRVWCSKLGSSHRQLAFVDTNAGAGRYGDGKPGSPLIAAAWNDHNLLASRGTHLAVHAFETDPAVAALLRTNLAPWINRQHPLAHVYETSFFDNPAAVLAATRSMPTLFFLDPFDIINLTADRLRPLLSDRNRVSTEVLVRLDPTLLARFAGWLRRECRTAADERYAASFGQLLSRLNVDTAQITEMGPEVAPDKMELFSQYLGLFDARFKFVQLIPIRADYWAKPKYFLIHGTDNAHGAAHLNDVVSTTEDGLFTSTEERRSSESGQGSLFEPERTARNSRRDLEEAVSEFLRAGEADFIDVRAAMVKRFGPDFREKHHKEAVKSLVDAGKIEHVGATTLTASSKLRLRQQR